MDGISTIALSILPNLQFHNKIAKELSSRGWMAPVPELMDVVLQVGYAGNKIRKFFVVVRHAARSSV